MSFSLFSITVMIAWVFWELSLANKENRLAYPTAVSREACETSLTGSLLDDKFGFIFVAYVKCAATLWHDLIYLFVYDSQAPVTWSSFVQSTTVEFR